MRSTSLALAAFLGLLVAMPPPACAQDDDLSDLGVRRRPGQAAEAPAEDFGANGPYLVLAGILAGDDTHERFGGPVDNSPGLDLRGGYRFHPNLAGELEFQWLQEFREEQDSNVHLDGWNLTANVKGYISTGRIQPYVLAGIGIIHGESAMPTEEFDATEFGVKGGLGLEIYLHKMVALHAEGSYNFGTDDLDDFRYAAFTWGLLFRP